MSEGLKELHDRLLAEQPTGAAHDKAKCPLCAMETIDQGGTVTHAPEPKGGSGVSTYSEEDLQAKVAEAVSKATKDLNDELAAIKAGQEQTEIDAKIAEATAERDTQIADLQGQLDRAVVEAAEAKKAKEDLEAFLQSEVEAAANAELASARKDDRLTKIREVAAHIPEEYLSEHGDRFAAMSDEDFEARLEEMRVIAGKATDDIPVHTSFTASRDNGNNGGGGNKGSALGLIRELRSGETDPRTL